MLKNLVRLALDLLIGWASLVTISVLESAFFPQVSEDMNFVGATAFALLIAIIIMFLADKYLQQYLPNPKKK